MTEIQLLQTCAAIYRNKQNPMMKIGNLKYGGS